MEYLINQTAFTKQPTKCLVVSIFIDSEQSNLIEQLDKLIDGKISLLIKAGDITGEIGQPVFLFPSITGLNQKILLVGCGKKADFDLAQLKKITSIILKTLQLQKVDSFVWDLWEVIPSKACLFAKHIPQIIAKQTYQFDQFKTHKQGQNPLSEIGFYLSSDKSLLELKHNLQQGHIIADAIHATKTLSDMPSNICNAAYLAEQAKLLGKKYDSVSVHTYGEKELASFNMNAYLAVGRGSQNESIMTVLEYHGGKDSNEAPYVFVGKGLTFDSGGISIKPAAGMDEMKYDMCGAATVYGVMQAAAQLRLPINIVGVMAGCENMPDGNAYRPSDILTTSSGITVEVTNTDAEGRLVLCDVLTYVERFNPKVVIDIATLTGACIVALGHHYTGVIGNNDKLIDDIIQASNVSDDKAWPLPMDDDFDQQIKSSCADIVNASGRDGGTITAACFLSRFTQKYPWAHLDIAGTAWKTGSQKGATGRPVAMLIEYLLRQ